MRFFIKDRLISVLDRAMPLYYMADDLVANPISIAKNTCPTSTNQGDGEIERSTRFRGNRCSLRNGIGDDQCRNNLFLKYTQVLGHRCNYFRDNFNANTFIVLFRREL